MAVILPPQRNEPLADGIGLANHRLSLFFEAMANEIEEFKNTQDASQAQLAQQNALILKLSKRIDDLEVSNDSDVLNSRLTTVASNLKKLIKDLLKAVEALGDSQVAIDTLCVQEKLFKEVKLLSVRLEEAFETGITDQDVSG